MVFLEENNKYGRVINNKKIVTAMQTAERKTNTK